MLEGWDPSTPPKVHLKDKARAAYKVFALSRRDRGQDGEARMEQARMEHAADTSWKSSVL